MVKEFRSSLTLDGELGFSRLIEPHCWREFVFYPKVHYPIGSVVDQNADPSPIPDRKSLVEQAGELKAFRKPSACKIVGHCGGDQQNIKGQYAVSEHSKVPR